MPTTFTTTQAALAGETLYAVISRDGSTLGTAPMVEGPAGTFSGTVPVDIRSGTLHVVAYQQLGAAPAPATDWPVASQALRHVAYPPAVTDGDRYEAARQAVEGLLRGARTGVRRWPGPDELIDPNAEPGPRSVPAARVEAQATGLARRGGRTTEGGRMLAGTLVVRTWTTGPSGADSRLLWGRVLDVLIPDAPDDLAALDAALEAAGIWSLTYRGGGLPGPDATGLAVVEAAGTFDLILNG